MSFLRSIIRLSSQRIGRKSAPQAFADDQVILRWSGAQVGFATILAWTRDGMRIRYHLPLQQHDSVKVIAPDWVLNAQVAWLCTVDGLSEAGLTFEPNRSHLAN